MARSRTLSPYTFPIIRRPTVVSRVSNCHSTQRRWITEEFIRRMQRADQQWAEYAKEIKAGKRRSFVEHLEDRCLVKDYVGLVRPSFFISPVYIRAIVSPTDLNFFLSQRTGCRERSPNREKNWSLCWC